MTKTATKTITGNAEKGIAREEVEVARQDLAGAEQRLRDLSQEASALPDQLRDALGQAAKERAEAARRGESAAYAPSDLTVEELRQRQGQIRLELWASRIAVEEARLALYAAEEELEKAKQADAQQALDEIAPAYEKLRQRYEAARGAASLDYFNLHRSDLKQESRDRLAELQASYPGALDA